MLRYQDGEQSMINRNIPAWVNWVAQDADGTWWGYEVEPLQHHQGWYENELGRCCRIKKDNPNPAWRQSLVQYPI